MKNTRSGQSVLEYALLFAIISGALLAMNTYVQRAMNARLKTIQLELIDSAR
jgi:Flp pilus assembly pilin Flp